MHVFKHFNGSWPHWYIEVIKNVMIGPDQIPTKSFKVILDHIEISLDAFLSFGQFILFGYMLVNSVHEFVFMTGFLIKFDAQIKEHELENIFTVLFCEVAELFVKGLGGWGKVFGCRLG